MVTNSNDNLLKLASLMIAEIESFFTSMQVGPRHPISEFSFESNRNAFYVIYAGNGFPLKAGVLLASRTAQEKGRIFAEVEMLGRLGYAATYRLLDLGSELLAIEIGRILLDLFGATLPLSGSVAAEVEVQTRSVAAEPQIMMPAVEPPGPEQNIEQPVAAAAPVSAPVVAETTAPPPVAPAPSFAAVLTDADGMPIKRKRGRPRKEEVLARQALLAAQAQEESGLPVPVPGSGEMPPRRRRGRPRKSESIAPHTDVLEINAERSVPSMPLVFENGEAMADVAPAEEQSMNGSSATYHEEGRNGAAEHTNGTTHQPDAPKSEEEDVLEDVQNTSNVLLAQDDGMPAFEFSPRGLPLTKNQRREMRRRELDRIRRENGAG